MDQPPKKSTAREVTEAAIEGGVGMIPIVGNPVAAAFVLAMGFTYNRRMQAWFEELAETVSDLQARTENVTFEELAEDEVFVDAVVNATRAAQATRDEDKLRALRNGVLNSLADDAPSADEQHRFFRLVEQFTAAHLRLLEFLRDPGAAFDRAGLERPNMMGGRGALLEKALPEFRGRREWYDLLMTDLSAAGLHNGSGLQTMMTTEGIYTSSTTALGERFLSFVARSPTPRG